MAEAAHGRVTCGGGAEVAGSQAIAGVWQGAVPRGARGEGPVAVNHGWSLRQPSLCRCAHQHRRM
eukprot:362825-Chlamydomonas_euryale.AAC.7